ncbi:RNA polymerase sigma factor [Leeuwenhoekiella sp. W20_SRS_FM14]|uniref:RNA polymerase sigma factor n=1 Tax=Leeuwenhoekiella sp. W20_SRS_FM14 TaxID=3240270 RepID=UPI003F967896
MSLEQLIIDCKRQKSKAQEALYRQFAATLFPVALKYARNYSEAEDILQESFIIIFEKVTQFKNKGSFEGWLKRIVINTALQRYRKQAVFEIINEENIEEAAVEVDDDEISLQFLLQIVQELPDRYRLVFNLYALDGYSHKEISKILEIKEGTSKSNLARARMILKEKVQDFQANAHLQASTQ